MAGALQRNLLSLHSCLQGDDVSTSVQRAAEICVDISHSCLQDVSEKENEYCCSLLFDPEKGMTPFLKKVVSVEEYRNVKVDLLEMLLGLMEKVQKKILPYAVDIKDVCVSLFLKDKFAKVKNATFPVLIKLLLLSAGSKVDRDLGVEKMVEKYFQEMARPTKYSSTVKGQMYHLLGVFAEVYPEIMVIYSDRQISMFITALKAEMTSKTRKPEMPIISGCLRGLTHYLVNFTQSAAEGAQYSYDIFKYMRMAVSKDLTIARYDMPRSALQLLTKHYGQMDQYLLDDYQNMYENLVHWGSHHNREVQHDGMLAMESFLKQISETLVARAEGGKKEGGIFRFFIQEFRKIMDNPSSSSKEVSTAIKGYGLFAGPCKLFWTDDDVRIMLNEIMQRSEQLFFSEPEMLNERMINLPSFLESLASIISQMDQVSEMSLVSLEKLVVILLENFPLLAGKLHYICFKAVLRVLFSLMSKGAAFRTFLSRTVYQGLIRTCSHPVVVLTTQEDGQEDAENESLERRKQKVSYKDYLNMWNSLLSTPSSKDLTGLGVGLEERHALTSSVYDELIQAVLTIMEKLDLAPKREGQEKVDGGADSDPVPGTSAEEADPGSSDPVHGLQASRPKDFIIFINLVDFCRDLLPRKHTDLFVKWILPFGNQVILHSTNNPLVSGFYKMLSVCMDICKRTHYFKGVGSDMSDRQDDKSSLIKMEEFERMDVDKEGLGDLVLVRLKQYKDDLLASCLTLILSLPKEIITHQMAAVVQALQTTLTMGLSYLPIAEAGLDALEYWSSHLSPGVIQPHYPVILPCLDSYLRTTDTVGTQGTTGEKTVTMAIDKASKGRKKFVVKVLQKGTEDSHQGHVSHLSRVRQRCVRLLGSLGGQNNSSLVSSQSEVLMKTAVSWDTKNHLKFDIPFQDLKPTIYFDPFLPRVVDLAMTSSDRQTKVAACEFLHSMVLFMLGRSATQPGGRVEKYPMTRLYKKIFPGLLRLACDVEQVTRTLFEPLVMQLIHWFTSSQMYSSEETSTLLKALQDGVVNPTDTALRDFSARCIREFLKWSIKQTSKKKLEQSQMNVKFLLKMIYSLAKHPSAFKRLGAALAFNNIYMVFREEESLVDIYTLEILAIFIESLALAHNDEKSLGTGDLCKKAVGHLERIIKARSSLLQKETKDRRKPRNWSSPNLDVLIRWLLRQCSRPHTVCRHTCMELVYKLAPCIKGANSTKELFQAYLKCNGPSYFIQKFETLSYQSTSSTTGLFKQPTLVSGCEVFSPKKAIDWFEILLAVLDCYYWTYGQDLLKPSIFKDKGKQGSVLFQSLSYFIENVAQGDICSVAKLYPVKTESMIFTPKETDDFNRIKCTVIVRIMNFLACLLAKHSKDSLQVIPDSFWSGQLWEMVSLCVLDPMNLGFNMGDVEILMKLPEETQQLLQILNRFLPAKIQQGFKDCLADKLSEKGPLDLFGKLPVQLSESSKNHMQLLHLVAGYEQLQMVGMLVPCLRGGASQAKLASQLMEVVVKGMTYTEDKHLCWASLSPDALDLAKKMLQLTFTLGIKEEDILAAVLDKTSVCVGGLSTKSSLGALFYATFRDDLSRHLVSRTRAFIMELVHHVDKEAHLVAGVLQGLLEHLAKDRDTRKKYGPEVVKVILSQWKHLKSWWASEAAQETKASALTLLTKVLLIDPSVCSDPSHSSFHDVFTMYQDLLTDKHTSLIFKGGVLDLLIFFTRLPAKELQVLRSKLDRFVADNFPLKSSEYTKGSPKYNDYITALNKLLEALVLSGSSMLLELLVSIMCRERQHIHEEEIQNALARFIKRIPGDKQKNMLDVVYNIFYKEQGIPCEMRRQCLERVCLPILRLAQLLALKEFFEAHISEIMEVIETKLAKSESALESQLVTKTCCFEMVEAMYSRLTKEDVNSSSSRINAAYCKTPSPTGKEMTQTITRAAHAAKSEDTRGESSHRDLRRQYHCMAYNALIAVISCTQTEMKFYKGFLFSDNLPKGQFLLENLVDPDKTYSFEMEMTSPLTRKKRFVSIRNEVRSSRQDAMEEEPGQFVTSIHYLASQYLADSSLSVDVSQYDFSSAMSGSLDRERRHSRQKSLLTKTASVEEPSVTIEGDYVEMEMDELNQHECMATLTGLLQHMKRNKLAQQLEKGSVATKMPDWMVYFHDKMKSSATPINTKLFIAKLIVNCEDMFAPYAIFWFEPITQLIVTGQIPGENINYFVIDLVVTMLSWHTVAIPEDNVTQRAMATRLTDYLMHSCHHGTRSVLRNNLEILKTLVEVWRDRIEVPISVIYNLFKNADSPNQENATGLQLLGVVLANRLPPYSSQATINKDRYFQHLAMNMTNKYKAVYGAAAEVVGMALKYLSEKETDKASKQWQEMYVDNISKMLKSIQQTKLDQFITCVFKMQQHYPPVADRFTNKLLFLLPKLHGEYKTHCLEVIRSRVDQIENLYLELKNKGFTAALTHWDEETQHVSLGIVLALLKHLKPEELLTLLPPVCGIRNHSSMRCRKVMYDILIWVYDNYRENDTEVGHQIMCQAKEGLLQGLSDEDLANRLTIQNFWSHETRLPEGTMDRMVAMLEAMYTPATEDQYLSYATNLLLEMTSKSPDYTKEIFEHPLSDCKFEDYRVSASWRQRHAAMTPLFVETQMSQVVGGSDSPDESMGTAKVRATQDVQQFTPTQTAGGSRAPFNWLTQSSLDTFADVSMATASETQSSLLFKMGRSEPKQVSFKPAGPGFGRDRLGSKPGAASEKPDSQSMEILRLKKRFMKENETSRLFFAKRNARIKKMRQEVLKEQQQRRENQVTLYRKYRTGDLPDIQIKYQYVIAPLQALAQKDNTIAKLLFSSVFKAIFAQIEIEKTEREAREITDRIQSGLNSMLSSSSQFMPAFIGCVLDIAYNCHKQLKLDPSNVYLACITGMQQPLGIVLLEEMLIQSVGEERSTKRARGAAVLSPEVSTWLELSRLYKSLGNYDVLAGIFSHKVGTQDVTARALSLEARGDYQGAVKCYNEALDPESWTSGQPEEIEKDLWDESRLQCYNHLTQWNKLEECTESIIDESGHKQLDKIWDEPDFQELYLPFLLRGKLKQLLQGEDQQSLLDFIDTALCVPDRKALLETRYSEELALMYIWQEDYGRARYYASNATEVFLQDWSSIDSLMTSTRTDKLQGLQRLAEMQEFLHFMDQDDSFSSDEPAIRIMKKWMKRSPDPLLDPPGVWDDIVTNRCVYVDQISARLQSSSQAMDVDEQGLFEEQKVVMRLAQASSAIQHDNIPVALKQLRATKSAGRNSENPTLQLKWTHTYVNTHLRRCQVTTEYSAGEKISILTGALTQLDKCSSDDLLRNMPSLRRQHAEMEAEVYQQLTGVMQNEVMEVMELAPDARNKITNLASYGDDQYDEIVGSLIEKGYQCMNQAVDSATSQLTSGGDLTNKEKEGVKSAYMKMFTYCDGFLRQRDEDECSTSNCVSLKQFPKMMIQCLLKAMKIGSTEARQRFPRLLQIVENYTDTRELFTQIASEIPCWMFIGWISQMTALLDKPEAPVVHQIVLSIAKEYPEALVYPFKMSMEGYKFKKNAEGKKNEAVCDRLKQLLSKNRLINALIEALEQFSQPNALFSDWFDDMRKLFESKSVDLRELQGQYQDMYSQLMDFRSGSDDGSLYDTQSTVPSKISMGKYRRKFAQKFAKDFDSLFGKGGSKLAKMSFKEFRAAYNKLKKDMDSAVSSRDLQPPVTLKEYCEFMASFDRHTMTQEIEIPGQYEGRSKPLPEYHVKIVSFEEKVQVMSSLRKPKSIVIRGNDEKEYKFLVKGGEDLRLDQRIEQLFSIMNNVLNNDPVCRQAKLQLRTYKVIPMTPRVGMIEWMNHTKPLKDFLLDSLDEATRKMLQSDRGPRADHMQMIAKAGTKKDRAAESYGKSYKQYSSTEIVNAFRKRENMVPWDMSRRAYQQMSASPEAYFTLRDNYALSHSVICVCQYILGIGDRHLSNFMVDLETGKMIGIDFGHAFGSATQFLPVPELMPFRLTRQLRNLMLPLKEKGLMEGKMVHTLRALRKDSDLLLNTMDVFIKEPSVDWQANAEKQYKTTMKSKEEEDNEEELPKDWYPREKVRFARRKLQGANPCYITKDEIELGHPSHFAKKQILLVLMGSKDRNVRARRPESGLTEEDQVACLIDQATDPNILGRTWVGWDPFI